VRRLSLPCRDPQAHLFPREGDEVLDLGVVHEAVPVRVGLVHGAAAPPGGQPPAASVPAEGLPELVLADPAVVVGVELLEEPLLEALHRHARVGRAFPHHRHRPRNHVDRHGWVLARASRASAC
jgi:hypothetical protein